MHFSLILLSLSAIVCAAPTWPQGPIISDDDTLMERREMVKVETVQAHTGHATNTMVTKITTYASNTASDVRGYLRDSFRGAMADSNGEVMTVSYGKKAPPFLMGSGKGRGRGGHHHGRHRISLLGFRNRLAVFILAFSLVLAVACSYLRRIYVAQMQKETDVSLDNLEGKTLPQNNMTDNALQS